MPDVTTNREKIVSRIAAAERFMEPYRSKARRLADRYLDSSARTLNAGADNAQDNQSLPVGEANNLAINIRTKCASIAIGRPDFTIKARLDPANGELVRQYIREEWRKKHWGRIFRRLLQHRYITGMGFLAYSWDRKKGFILEFCRPEDVFFDPHTTDETWDNPRYAGRYIYLPLDVAEERYGKQAILNAKTENQDRDISMPLLDSGRELERDSFKVTLYWDELSEVELYGGTVLRAGRNLYERIPLFTFQGEPNPKGEFGLGDFDTSLGIMEMVRRLQNVLNNVAEHGGGIPWLREEFINEKIRQAVIAGTHRGYVLVNGVPGEQAVGYTANQPINPAVLDALRLMNQALDSDQGSTEYDRGVLSDNPKFASQVLAMTNRAGARSNLARIDFETFVEGVCWELVQCTEKFGLDPAQEPTDEARALWEACKDVYDLEIIEQSLAYKDPAMQQQQNLQLLSQAIAAAPIMAQQGVFPNLKAIFDDVLRSFGRRNDLEKYYVPVPPAPNNAMMPGGSVGGAEPVETPTAEPGVPATTGGM